MTEQDSSSQVDIVPTKGLWNEYGIKETKFYAVLKELGIDRLKRGTLRFITGADKQRLDRYFQSPWEFAKTAGLTLREDSQTFTNNSEELGMIEHTQQSIALEIPQLAKLGETLEQISKQLTQQDPTARYRYLYYFANNKVCIPTSTIKALTGTKPKGQTYCWSNFKFDRLDEKIGREQAWVVSKRDLGN